MDVKKSIDVRPEVNKYYMKRTSMGTVIPLRAKVSGMYTKNNSLYDSNTDMIIKLTDTMGSMVTFRAYLDQ